MLGNAKEVNLFIHCISKKYTQDGTDGVIGTKVMNPYLLVLMQCQVTCLASERLEVVLAALRPFTSLWYPFPYILYTHSEGGTPNQTNNTDCYWQTHQVSLLNWTLAQPLTNST